MKNNRKPVPYQGFEQGPIRPPSEAFSMLFRLTRNCPWNNCTFCSVYKKDKFSFRPIDHIIRDIDTVWGFTRDIRENQDPGKLTAAEEQAYYAARQWIHSGMTSVFLQDANSVIMKPEELIHVLHHIRKRFPQVERITSYARSHTIARISDDNLKKMAEAGLNRIHIGLETGSDEILTMVKKGVTKREQIKAGQKVKRAGMQLSEYVLTGVGGKHFSKVHALETADVLNQVNADFIRFRTLHIPETLDHLERREETSQGYVRPTDLILAREILFLIENLEGIDSYVKSYHMLNLFEEVDGKLPRDKEKIMGVLKEFIGLDPMKQVCFQIGKRVRVFHRLRDLEDSGRMDQMEDFCREKGITPENVDDFIHEMVQENIRLGMSL